jgi:hypothetical protein
MRAFMDEFDVVPGTTGGAEIVMAKRLPGAENGHSNSHPSSSGSDSNPQEEA